MRNRPELLRALITTVLGFAAVPVGDWFYGAYCWNAGTQELQARLGAARVPVRPRTVDLREPECLPAPVQRYFRVVPKGAADGD